MASFNKVILMGNLTKDPESRTTPGGTELVLFSMAVNNRINPEKEDVLFMDCVAFGKTGEVVRDYLTKGMPVMVEGRLHQERWEKDGQKRSKIELVVISVTFVGHPKPAAGKDSPPPDLPGESDIPY